MLPLAQASSAHLLTMGISITLLTPQTGTAKQGLPVMQARPGSLPLAQPSAAADAASAAGGGLLAPAVLQGPLLGSEHLLYSNTQHTASHGRRLLAPPVLQGLLWQTHSK